MQKLIAISIVAMTAAVVAPMQSHAQNPVSPTNQPGVLAGTLYDPLEEPARQVARLS
jgi:hypothetical protein